MKLSLAYFYQEELNLYGDTGNVEILTARARLRGFDVEVLSINSSSKINTQALKEFNLIFMGGGPDSGQKDMYHDLLTDKKPYLKDYIENGGVSLFICGAYQLLGHYYKSADGSVLDGLGIFDMHTQHFGHDKQRCVGNTSYTLSERLTNDPTFSSINKLGTTAVGFENHGGRTYLKDTSQSFATVRVGFGNNDEDSTEGIFYKNAIGTYSHGPLLSKNPHIADFLIAKALKLETLDPLDDKIIHKAHTALLDRN